MRGGPLLLPAGVAILGVELGTRSADGSPAVAMGLLAAGIALGRRGIAVSALAVGLLAVWVRPARTAPWLEPGLAVAVEGCRTMPWRRDAYGWSAPVRVHTIRQGRRVEVVRIRLRLTLSGAERPPPGRGFRAQGYLKRAPPLGNGGPAVARAPGLRVKSRRLVRFWGAREPWLASIRGAGRERGRGSDGVALARALVLGDRSELSPQLTRGFRRAGLGHLLALSGLHVGILAGIGLWLGRVWLGGLGCGRWQWLVPSLGALAFLVVVGPRPAVLRATWMALLIWASLARGARPLSGNALAAVAAGMVVAEPGRLRELGFLLTVAATAGILLQTGAMRGRSGVVSEALRMSAAAQLFTLPWTLPAFHLAAPAAVVHNLWAVPWTAVVLVASAAWIGLATIRPATAARAEVVLDAGVAPFRWISRLPAGPWWSVPLAAGRLEALLAGIVGANLLRNAGRGRGLALLAGLALAASFGVRGCRSATDPEVAMLDVGQGEAILLRDRESAVLVDGGGWLRGEIGGRVLLPALARLGVGRLRAVVLTHPDLDHCGGLVGIAAYLPVDEVWTPAGWRPDPCLLDLLTRAAVGWRPVWAGWRGRVGRWRVRAVAPPAGARGEDNDRSLVLSARVRGFGVLLTGDIEARAEAALVAGADRSALRADLLKVPHHGSRTSTGASLLELVAPRLAWISAGRANRYGHPHPTVVARLAEHGVRVLRTDRDGMIHLRIGPRGSVHLSLPGTPK